MEKVNMSISPKFCPMCGGENVAFGDVTECQDERSFQSCICNDCKYEWVRLYKFVDKQLVKVKMKYKEFKIFCPNCHRKQQVEADMVKFDHVNFGIVEDDAGELHFDYDTIDLDGQYEYHCAECGEHLADTMLDLQDRYKRQKEFEHQFCKETVDSLRKKAFETIRTYYANIHVRDCGLHFYDYDRNEDSIKKYLVSLSGYLFMTKSKIGEEAIDWGHIYSLADNCFLEDWVVSVKGDGIMEHINEIAEASIKKIEDQAEEEARKLLTTAYREFRSKPGHCIRCGSMDIEQCSPQIEDDSTISRKCYCRTCFYHWVDSYKLSADGRKGDDENQNI